MNIVTEICRNGRTYPDAPQPQPWRHVDAACRVVCCLDAPWRERYGHVVAHMNFDEYAAERQRPLPSKSESVESYLCRLHDWRSGWSCPEEYAGLIRECRERLILCACRERGIRPPEADVQEAATGDEVIEALGYTTSAEGVQDFLSDYSSVASMLTTDEYAARVAVPDGDVLDLLVLDAASFNADYGRGSWAFLVEAARSRAVLNLEACA